MPQVRGCWKTCRERCQNVAGVRQELKSVVTYLVDESGLLQTNNGVRGMRSRIFQSFLPSSMKQMILRFLRSCFLVLTLQVASLAHAADAVSDARSVMELGSGQSALELLLPEAARGNVDAWYWLGRLFFYDIPGVPQDDLSAARWFARAAHHGHANAQYKLGGMYFTGRGVKEASLSQAAIWWVAAAKQNQPEALNNLGALLATGTGIKRDEEMGLVLQLLAKHLGSETAKENVARKVVSPMALQRAEAFQNDPKLLSSALSGLMVGFSAPSKPR